MYCIAVLIDKGQKGQDYAEYILNYCCRQKDISPGSDLSGSGKFFEKYKKTNTVHCASGTSGSSRAECCGASPFPASEMQNDLVQ